MNQNITKLLSEFLGTFVFLFTILQSGRFSSSSSPSLQPWVIVSGLLVAIFAFGSYSGGHFNPAVSTMLYVADDVNVNTLGNLSGYIVAQVVAGCLAFWVFKKLNTSA